MGLTPGNNYVKITENGHSIGDDNKTIIINYFTFNEILFLKKISEIIINRIYANHKSTSNGKR